MQNKNSAPAVHDFDLLIFVGRFQPFHFGHLSVVKEALKRSRHVLMLVGSANAARSVRNPFTYDERQRMIADTVSELPFMPNEFGLTPASRIIIKPLHDHLYNDAAWMQEVQSQVYSTIENDLPAEINGGTPRVGLIGHNKDNSSYYLRIFPNFSCVDVKGYPCMRDDVDRKNPNPPILSSTIIRDRMFAHVLDSKDDAITPFGEMADAMPPSVRGHLDRIWRTAPFKSILEEMRYVHEYKQQWNHTPYPVTFTTVDAIVTCNGHILMVERGDNPGKGQMALPGGFIRHDETLFDGCVRELYEETQIKLPRKVVLGAARSKMATTFDDPWRSVRGRTITHAFRFDLNEVELPKVKGADDAAKAMWVPIASITPEKCFEDHGHIIRHMLGVA